MVTTHGEIEVPTFLARKGPRGTYSHFYKDVTSQHNPHFELCTLTWISLALQSFMRTMPKM
jgi:hypothetical protein